MASASSSDYGLKAEIGGGGGGENSDAVIANDQLLLYRGLKKAKKERGCTAKERISKMPPCTAGKRSSIYRGVTRHRWTGRYEAHLWDKSTWNQNQNKKGKQVYLGAYDDEEAAARAYDLAALKYWGPGTLINFPVTDYMRDLDEMHNVTREDYLASLRRKSSGFSRGISKYRGLSSLFMCMPLCCDIKEPYSCEAVTNGIMFLMTGVALFVLCENSRWDSSIGSAAGSEYLSSINYGDETATENDILGRFYIERKIDLTSYIKWWGSNRNCEADASAKSLDVCSELKTLEQAIHQTKPYEMPRLDIPIKEDKQRETTLSALSILSQSAAYKSLEAKAASKKQESCLNRMDHGKGVEKAVSVYPLASTSCTPPPLLTKFATVDPLADPIAWTSLVPIGSSSHPEVTKTETSSSYTLFRTED